jgi:hypothetical protein
MNEGAKVKNNGPPRGKNHMVGSILLGFFFFLYSRGGGRLVRCSVNPVKLSRRRFRFVRSGVSILFVALSMSV